MSVKLTTEYKEHTISFDGNSFSITHSGIEVSSRCKSLESCVALIDKLVKVKFNPLEVLVKNYRTSSFEKVKATSFTADTDVKIIGRFLEGTDKGELRHFSPTEVFELSEENLTIIENLQQLENKKLSLLQEARNLQRALVTFDYSKLISLG